MRQHGCVPAAALRVSLRSSHPLAHKIRHVSRMVRRYVAKQRPQQLVRGHSLVELHHQGIQHFRSAEPLIQRGNLLFFFGHVIRFPFFDSALFYRHPLPSTWGAASASPFAAAGAARPAPPETFLIRGVKALSTPPGPPTPPPPPRSRSPLKPAPPPTPTAQPRLPLP